MRRIYFLSGLLFLFLFSCKREGSTSWDTDVLAPLANGRITLNEIVLDSLLYADENSLWHFRFHEDLTDFDLDTLVEIPDTVITKSFVVPLTGGPFTIPPGQVIISEQENNLINANDVLLKEVRMKSGYLMYSVKSYIDGYLNCIYKLPGVTLNGVPTIIQTTTQPGTDATPFVFSGSIDLTGYKLDLTGETGFMFNRVFSDLTVSSALNASGPTLVSGYDSLQIELKFVDPKVSYARGYFGQHNYQLNESVSFSDEINFPDGLLNLESASMKFEIENNVGVDAQIHFTEVSNSNTTNSQQVTLQYAPLYQPVNISRAYDVSGEILATQLVMQMDNTNSNITSFIENLPDEFNMQASVVINPLQDVTDGNDFVYTDRALQASLDIDIPLRIAAQNLVLADTIDLQPLKNELSANGFLELHIDNAFPFEAGCTLSVLNGDTELSLISNQLISSAIPTENDAVTIPTRSIIRIPVYEDLLLTLANESRLVIRIALTTPGFDQVHGLYEHYYMDFKLIANGVMEVKYE